MASLNLKKKDDIVIKLTECLDKYNSVHNLSDKDSVDEPLFIIGKILALKWVLGYDELDEIEKEEDDDYEPDPHYNNEIDMSKL